MPQETNAGDRAPGDTVEPEQERRLNPIMAAAIVGGTVAAAAGAYFGTRSLARRNREENGKPINSVLATAITACDLAHAKDKDAARAPQSSDPHTQPASSG